MNHQYIKASRLARNLDLGTGTLLRLLEQFSIPTLTAGKTVLVDREAWLKWEEEYRVNNKFGLTGEVDHAA